MEEKWEMLEEDYAVSNLGRVASKKRMAWQTEGKWHLMSLSCSEANGFKPTAHINGAGKTVEKLVAEKFVPNPYGYKYVKHLDNDIKNNKAENLIWAKGHVYYGKALPKESKADKGILKKINKEIEPDGMMLRIVRVGLINYLQLGNKNLVDDCYASVQLKERSIEECIGKMNINSRSTINLKRLVKVYEKIEGVLNEHKSSNSN